MVEMATIEQNFKHMILINKINYKYSGIQIGIQITRC
jgi:hypothetical protein